MDSVRFEVEQRGVAAADDPAVRESPDTARGIVLVPDLADDLLEDVLDGDDAVEYAVLVEHRADRGALLLHPGEQNVERQRRRHHQRLVPEGLDRPLAL